MADWTAKHDSMRMEAHYGDRVVACYPDRATSLIALLQDAAARNGSGCALVCGSSRWSWDELEQDAERLAAGLAERGLGKGDRVILFLGNRAEFVVFLFALMRLGAIVVPVSTREQAAGLRYMAEHSAAAAIVYETSLADRVPEDLDILAVMLPSDAAALDNFFGHETVPPCDLHEEDAALILYTSGTTGRPKGAVITHMALVHAAMAYGDCMRLGSEDRSICVVPLSHVTALAALLAPVVRAASRLVILDGFDVPGFLAAAARERMTHSVLVPAMYNLILARADLSQHDLSAWRVGAFGGAPMPVPTIEKLALALPELALMNCYGATETTLAAAIMPPEHARSHHDCVGQVTPGTKIRVMDENGHEVAAGEPGELWISGPSITAGYWRNEAATRANLTGGWWRSGDMGSVDALGFVRIHDRIKDMINRGGYKIYSAEVENVLASHPAVLEAAVIPKACPVLGERVLAVVVAERAAISHSIERALIDYCAAALADYKVPERIHVVALPLPRNANGKVVKRALIASYAAKI